MIEFSANALRNLRDRYVVGNESEQDIFTRVAKAYGTDAAHTERIYSYFEKRWFMPASPVLCNGGTDRGLPISCYLNTVADSREDIGAKLTENLWLGTNGGGIGTYFGDIRSIGQLTSRGIRTTGAMQYMHVFNAMKMASNQGKLRQASNAIFMPMHHPEIKEFIKMRIMEGDFNRKNPRLDHGVCITDEFMEAVRNDRPWNLIDPHTKEVIETVSAVELWELILETKASDGRGEPYIVWIDRMNEKLHPDLKEQGFVINGSNLCVEISLPTAEDYTNVCCLSSVIVENYDEWQSDPLFIGDCVEFLDNVMSDFIERCPDHLWRARRAAEWERSLGLGQMGWHSFTQKMSIPWGTPASYGYNIQIAKHIYEHAWTHSRKLAETRGTAKGLKSDRNAHLIAIAPNATTAVLADTSPTIEPWDSNYFMQDGISGAMPTRNDRYLGRIIEKRYGDKADDAWMEILQNEGSVQRLEKLSAEEKALYRTPYEMDQRILTKMAVDRQPYVCQAQSFNLFFPPGSDRAYVDEVYWQAYDGGLKSQYYFRTKGVANGSDTIMSIDKSESSESSECFACSG